MPWKQGDVFRCATCACEVTLSKVPARAKAELEPLCPCCGQGMSRV